MLLGFCFTWRWQIPERMCTSKEKAHWGERNGGGKVSGHVRNSQVLEKAEGGFLHALYASKGLSITSGLLTPCCCCNKSPQRWWLKQHQRVLLQLRNLKSLSCGWSYSVGRAVFLLEGPWESVSHLLQLEEAVHSPWLADPASIFKSLSAFIVFSI